MKYIGQAIREHKGYTSEELSQKTGISKADIESLERGVLRSITTKELSEISKALECKISELII